MSWLSKLSWVRFLTCIAVSCGLVWLGGFDFDHRDEWVASWALVTLVFSLALASEN